MKRIIRRMVRKFGLDIVKLPPSLKDPPKSLSYHNMLEILAGFQDSELRNTFFTAYRFNPETIEFFLQTGKAETLQKILASNQVRLKDKLPVAANQKYTLVDRIHYGCGSTFLEDWLNVDWMNHENIYRHHSHSNPNLNYAQANLAEKHNFPDDFFRLGFAEDFLEHLDQADSLVFLSECFRTFRKGGILRLSFPGLEGVLKKHYRTSGFAGSYEGKIEAYTLFDHLHFYSRDEISLVATHAGFTSVEFVEYRKSRTPELENLDTRVNQIGLNTYVELTK